jgi:hypothetical protein
MRRPFRDTYVYVSSVAYASATRKAFGRKILGLTPPRISARRGKTSKRVESGLLAPRPQAVSSTKVRCVHRGDLTACRPRLCSWAGRLSTGPALAAPLYVLAARYPRPARPAAVSLRGDPHSDSIRRSPP